jgi:hypothetical protein
VRKVDFAGGLQPGEILPCVDLADLVPAIGNVAPEALLDQSRVAARVRRPADDATLEIDVDHHPAEIEQQGIGGSHGHALILADG